MGEARNRAFDYLKGKYVAVLDTDDIWFPSKLEKQIKYFSDEDVGIVISNAYFFNEKRRVLIYDKKPFEGWAFLCLFRFGSLF